MPISEAKTVADAVLASLETVAVMAVGNYEEVRFTPKEKESIAEPLARTIQRMSPSAIGRYQALTDPITVIAVAGMWMVRVYQVNQIKQQDMRDRRNGNRDTSANATYSGAAFSRNDNGNYAVPTSGVNGNHANPADTDDGATGNTGSLSGFGRQSY